MRTLLLRVGLVWLLLPGVASAAQVAGQDEPRFRVALERWLADDDAAALPEFAALAAEGNRAAQVLLALVEANTSLQGPWVAGRARAERIALMRRPGGLSGRSWMEAAAADTPLAAAWFAFWRGRDRDEIAIARAFAAMGEDRAVRDTLVARSLGDRRGLAALADEPFYPPSLRFLVWREWATDPGAERRIAEEVAALPAGDPQRATVTGRQAGGAERAAWLAEDPSASPLRAFCDTACPESRPACLEAAYAFHDSPPDLGAFGSPWEGLIASANWEATPRGRATVLRRTLPGDPALRARKLAEVAALDACFGAALAAEAARFPD